MLKKKSRLLQTLSLLLAILLLLSVHTPTYAARKKILLVGDSRLVGMYRTDKRISKYYVLAQGSGSGRVDISSSGKTWTWLSSFSGSSCRVNTLTGDITSSINLVKAIKKKGITDIVYMMGRNSITSTTYQWSVEQDRMNALKKATRCRMWFGYVIPDASTRYSVNTNISCFNLKLASNVPKSRRIDLYTPMRYHDSLSHDGVHYSDYSDAIDVLVKRLR